MTPPPPGDPKDPKDLRAQPRRPPPSPGARGPEVPTQVLPVLPSGKSLGEDPTSLVSVPSLASASTGSDNSATAMVIVPDASAPDRSDTALVPMPQASQAEGSATALVVMPEASSLIEELNPSAILPAPSQSLLRAPDEPTIPDRSRSSGKQSGRAPLPPTIRTKPIDDATAVMSADRNDATALIQTPTLRANPNEPSLGAKVTNPGAGDETAVRQVFSRFAPEPSRRRRSDEALIKRGGTPLSMLSSPRLWIAILSTVLVGLIALGVGTWYTQTHHLGGLLENAQGSVMLAHKRGNLADFTTAETQLRALLGEQPSDGAAIAARALMLGEALYEFGGGPDLNLTQAEAERVDGGLLTKQTWADEAQSAARQSEGENRPTAIAALVFVALAHADPKLAESQLGRLAGMPPTPTGQGQGQGQAQEELTPLPGGIRDYLASQAALIQGKSSESIELLRTAVAKNPLPLWQRRLGFQLSREGRDAEALPLLTDVEKRHPEQCGARIDLAYLRARSATGSLVRPALATLRGFADAPRLGGDPCGRGERARAAQLSAELTLATEPTARAETRALLEKAQALALPDDVVLADAIALVWLRTGDAHKAEKLSRTALERVPTRRHTRLLLAQALLAQNQGNEAVTVLEPLTAPGDSGGKQVNPGGDFEAQVWRAQALLQLNDTLEAQRLTRRVLGSSGVPTSVRNRAQLLLARIYLRLQEPAAARRALEPVMRQTSSDSAPTSPTTPATTPDSVTSSEQQLDAQLLWAQALLVAKPPEQSEARALLEAVVGRAPERVEARLMLGRLLRELHEWGQAEQQLSAALRTDDHYTPARRELAALLMQRGDFAKAHALYRELVKEEQDADLLLAAARAERLDGAPEQGLTTLGGIKRSRGEVLTKHDEPLLAERARALLALDRCGEAEVLLQTPGSDLQWLKRPTLTALLIRSQLCAAAGPQKTLWLTQARSLLDRTQPAWRTDPDVRLAEAELLVAEDKPQAARPVLEALIASLQTVPPTSVGEETALRQQAERLLAPLPPAGAASAPAGKQPVRKRR